MASGQSAPNYSRAFPFPLSPVGVTPRKLFVIPPTPKLISDVDIASFTDTSIHPLPSAGEAAGSLALRDAGAHHVRNDDEPACMSVQDGHRGLSCVFSLSFFFFFIFPRQGLCSPGCLELRDPHASACQVLELKAQGAASPTPPHLFRQTDLLRSLVPTTLARQVSKLLGSALSVLHH